MLSGRSKQREPGREGLRIHLVRAKNTESKKREEGRESAGRLPIHEVEESHCVIARRQHLLQNAKKLRVGKKWDNQHRDGSVDRVFGCVSRVRDARTYAVFRFRSRLHRAHRHTPQQVCMHEHR